LTTVAGGTRNRIARVKLDATLDTDFNPSSGANHAVRCIVVQSDNKVVIGGDFTQLNGSARNRIGRLLSNGSLDDTFRAGDSPSQFDLQDPLVPDPPGTPYVACLAVGADGLIAIGGKFRAYQVQGLSGSATFRGRVARIGGL